MARGGDGISPCLAKPILPMPIPMHRLAYLSFVSRKGQRGRGKGKVVRPRVAFPRPRLLACVLACLSNPLSPFVSREREGGGEGQGWGERATIPSPPVPCPDRLASLSLLFHRAPEGRDVGDVSLCFGLACLLVWPCPALTCSTLLLSLSLSVTLSLLFLIARERENGREGQGDGTCCISLTSIACLPTRPSARLLVSLLFNKERESGREGRAE